MGMRPGVRKGDDGDSEGPELMVSPIPRPSTAVLLNGAGTQCCGLIASKEAPETFSSYDKGFLEHLLSG